MSEPKFTVLLANERSLSIMDGELCAGQLYITIIKDGCTVFCAPASQISCVYERNEAVTTNVAAPLKVSLQKN